MTASPSHDTAVPPISAMCRLCGRRPADSREHVPGRHAANAGPVWVRHMAVLDGTGRVRHEEGRYADGFALRSLCQKCNNKTGSRYGAAYLDFVRQFGATGHVIAPDGRAFIELERMRPARIAKQMVAMFVASQPRALPAQLDGLRRFVLGRDAVLPDAGSPEAISIYLYRNGSQHGRIVPVSSIMELWAPGPVEERSLMFAEVSWPPVGLVFCFAGGGWLERRGIVDVSEWGRRPFDAVENFRLLVPTFTITTDHPLAFGSPDEVERWRTERGVIWALGGADDPDAPTANSLIWCRDR